MAQAFMTDRPPRLLMIVSGYPPAKKAGMERGCQRLAEALARRGHEVAVLTQWAKGLAPQEEPMENLRIERRLRPLALGPLWGATYMLQVGREMRRLAGEWDVCVCHKLDLHSQTSHSPARRRRGTFASATSSTCIRPWPTGRPGGWGRVRCICW